MTWVNQSVLCMCNSTECTLSIQIPLEEAREILSNNWILIVDHCPKGPDAQDKIVRPGNGYTVYRTG